MRNKFVEVAKHLWENIHEFFTITELKDYLREQFAVKVSEDLEQGVWKLVDEILNDTPRWFNFVARHQASREGSREAEQLISSFVQSREKAAVIEKLVEVARRAGIEPYRSTHDIVNEMLSELKGGE